MIESRTDLIPITCHDWLSDSTMFWLRRSDMGKRIAKGTRLSSRNRGRFLGLTLSNVNWRKIAVMRGSRVGGSRISNPRSPLGDPIFRGGKSLNCRERPCGRVRYSKPSLGPAQIHLPKMAEDSGSRALSGFHRTRRFPSGLRILCELILRAVGKGHAP